MNHMPKWKTRKPDFDWKELVATDADLSAQSPAQLRSMLQQLYLIRAFEMKLLELKGDDLIHGCAGPPKVNTEKQGE